MSMNRSTFGSDAIYARLYFPITVAIGLGLRLRGMTSAFETDEVWTVRVETGGWAHFWQTALRNRPHPPLHVFLLRLWMGIFGNSAIALRSLSVLFSVGFLVLVWFVARKLTSAPAALMATALCAVSPFFVYYGQQARPYAMIACLSVLSVWLMLRLTEQPESAWLKFAYFAVCAALILSQYAGLVFIYAELLAWVVLYRWPLRRVLLYAASPFPAFVWFVAARINPSFTMVEFLGFIERPKLRSVPYTVVTFFALPSWPLFQYGKLIIAATIAIAFIGLGLWFARAENDRRRKIALCVLLASSVPTAMFILSQVAQNSYWADRHMIGSATMLSMAMAAGLMGCKAWVRSFAVGALFLCLLAATWATPPQSQRPPWDQIAESIHQQCPGCRVVALEEWPTGPLSIQLGYPVELVASLPPSGERLALVCRPLSCNNQNSDLTRMRRIASYDWYRTWREMSPLEVYVTDDAQSRLHNGGSSTKTDGVPVAQ